MKSFIYYLIITMLGQIVMITDFFLNDNILAYIILPGTLTNATFIYMIYKKRLIAKYFYIFTFMFSI